MHKNDNRTYIAHLVAKKDVAVGMFEYEFSLEREFLFEVGQYVWVRLISFTGAPLHRDRHAYSVVNIPDGSGRIRILFHASESAYTKILMSLEIGARVEVIGPFGFEFRLPADTTIPLVLLAGGTGIAPFMSLMRFAQHEKLQTPLSLLYSYESPDRACYLDEITQLGTLNKNQKHTFTSGKLSEQDISQVSKSKKSLFYICGPQGFVDYVYALLLQLGIKRDRMRFESFYPTPPGSDQLRILLQQDKLFVDSSESEFSKQRAELIYSLVNASETHTIVTDLEGTILFANKAAERITGYTFEEMRGNTPRLWGGMMSQELYRQLWDIKNTGQPFNSELLVNRRKNGDLYFVTSHIAPIKDNNGNVIGFLASEEDVTHLKNMQLVTAEVSERLFLATQAAKVGIWELDLETQELVWDARMFELHGIKPVPNSTGQLLAAWKQVVHPDDLKKFEMKILQTFEKFVSFSVKYRVIMPDKTIRHIKMYVIARQENPDGVVKLVGANFDVTRETQIDEEKSEFVSLASHQLKTPVAALNWNMEMLLNNEFGKLRSEQKEVILEMNKLGHRMNELVNSLLNISRIELGVFIIEPTPTNLLNLCEEVIAELRKQIQEKRHSVVEEFDKKLPLVSVDPKLMRIIFQNLLSNAIKYTPPEGKIFIGIETKHDEVIVEVKNNGEPIPTDEQPNIFTKLFRASNAQAQDPDGNGLGLYMVKKIVDNAGGKIWFTSAPGEDTVFSVSFPLSGMRKKKGNRSLT